MKSVLCSEGFSTASIIEETAKLCGKLASDISIAIINEAYAVKVDDKRWVLDNLNSAVTNFGGEIDIVNLLALSIQEVETRVAAKDVIYVIGGSTDYLMSVFQNTGFDKLLPKLLETKIYVGSSAGSMVAGRRMSSEAYKHMYGHEGTRGIDTYLNLVDFSIFPHLGSLNFQGREEAFRAHASSFTEKTYGIRDDSAVIVNDDQIYTVGSEPVIVENGEIR